MFGECSCKMQFREEINRDGSKLLVRFGVEDETILPPLSSTRVEFLVIDQALIHVRSLRDVLSHWTV